MTNISACFPRIRPEGAQLKSQRKVEKELRENEAQLRELNKTKDRLFSIIGHDLRSPFNNILGFSDLLIKRLNDSTFKDSEKYLKIINGLANNTLILLDNLLNWAKSQTGVLSIHKENILLSDIILEVIMLMLIDLLDMQVLQLLLILDKLAILKLLTQVV